MAKRNHAKQPQHKTKGGNAKQTAAYRAFATTQRAQRTDLHSMSAKEQAQVLGAEWQQLSAQEQHAYHSNAPGMHKTRAKSHAGARAKHQSHAKRVAKKTTKRRASHKGAHHGEHAQAYAHDAAHHSHE